MFAVCCKPQASDRSDDEEPASTMKATLVEKSPAKKPEKSTTPPSLHTEILLRRLSNEDVFKKYRVEKVLGQGSMGSVSLVSIRHGKIGGSAFESKSKGFLGLFRRRKRTGKLKEDSTSPHTYALKSIILDRVSNTFLMELQNEIEILRTLDHPNIVKLHEVYTYMKQIYLVLESCDGGDLYARSPYSEREAGKIMAQLLSAVSYMHEHGVVHRDLKFENIMFESTREDARIKVIDFGLSKKFIGEPKYMTECVGTIYTMAPAVLQGIYSSNADLWSAGVIAYMLLSATKPFWHKRRKRMIDMIMRCHYTMEGGVWESISPAAKDFVSHLIVLDPKERYSAAQALKHEWIVNRERLPNERPTEALLESIDGSLLNYKNTSALKKIALTVIAHRSNTGDIMELRNAFSAFDTENDGTISFEEFKEGLKKLKYSDEMLKDIFSSIDVNKNGKINYTEFLAATIEAHGHIAEDRIAEAFDRIDSDDTGYISRENLRELLGKDCRKEDIEAVMAWGDADRDGKISYEEFLAAFRAQTATVAHKVAHMETVSSHTADGELLGLDAKVPGGRYDSDLSPSRKAQIK